MTPHNSDPVPPLHAVPDVRRLSVPEAHRLVESGSGLLVDTRGPHHYDNAHAAGAVSLPVSMIEADEGPIGLASLPADRLLILYCA
jgi:rhodanese-related sulfurtransferase